MRALWALLIVGAAALLYHISGEVAAEERTLAVLRVELAAERDRLMLLEAEWAVVTAPERLAELAARHTDLRPLDAAQLGAAPRASVGVKMLEPAPPDAGSVPRLTVAADAPVRDPAEEAAAPTPAALVTEVSR